MRLKLSGIEVKAARVLVGMKGHAASAFSACIGSKLKGKEYPKPPDGAGGRKNPAVRKAFVQASSDCSRELGKKGPSAATKRKFGIS
ncbi:MAG: hypothetical protein V1724_06585 [Chloroflexota bacterium]